MQRRRKNYHLNRSQSSFRMLQRGTSIALSGVQVPAFNPLRKLMDHLILPTCRNTLKIFLEYDAKGNTVPLYNLLFLPSLLYMYCKKKGRD